MNAAEHYAHQVACHVGDGPVPVTHMLKLLAGQEAFIKVYTEFGDCFVTVTFGDGSSYTFGLED